MTDKNSNLVYIPIDRLLPHPDNPRKDLGDLTELSESIKTKGVMQNLTVVPFENPDTNSDGCFRIIIGHRRHSAAKLAGLKELPCVIVDMSPKDQIATMLLENMQRSDLTIYEQAQGFQMMLDLGDSVDEIAEKTGFSKSTVRRRVQLTELDKDTLRDISTRQFSFGDINKLSQIENVEDRNSVLSTIGTNNFENSFRRALDTQKKQKKRVGWEKLFKKYEFKEVDYGKIWSIEYTTIGEKLTYLDGEPDESVIKELLSQCKGEQIYYAFGYDKATPYIRVKDSDYQKKKEKQNQAQAEQMKRCETLNEIGNRAFELRRNFIKSLPFNVCKKNKENIANWALTRELAAFACCTWFEGYSTALAGKRLFNFLFDIEDESENNYEFIKEYVEKHPEKALLFHTYALWCDSEAINCYDYSYAYKANDKLKKIYEGLKLFGYEISDEEQQMIDGTLSYYTSNGENLDVDECVAEENDELDDDEFDSELAELMEKD